MGTAEEMRVVAYIFWATTLGLIIGDIIYSSTPTFAAATIWSPFLGGLFMFALSRIIEKLEDSAGKAGDSE